MVDDDNDVYVDVDACILYLLAGEQVMIMISGWCLVSDVNVIEERKIYST